MVKDRFLSFAMVFGVGFLLLVSLVIDTAIAAMGKYAGSHLPGGEALWHIVELAFSFCVDHGADGGDFPAAARSEDRMARRLARRGADVAALRPRQVRARHLLRQERGRLELRRRRLAGPGAALGLLLRADPPLRRRVHAGLRALARQPERGSGCEADGEGERGTDAARRREAGSRLQDRAVEAAAERASRRWPRAAWPDC